VFRQRLLSVAMPSLSVTSEVALLTHNSRPALAPGSTTAFTLDPLGEHLVRLDLATGAEDVVATLGSPAAAVAVDEDYVYLAVPRLDQVRVLDRATFRPRRSNTVGAHPIDVMVGPQI